MSASACFSRQSIQIAARAHSSVQAGVCSAIIASFAREKLLIHKLFLKAEEIIIRVFAAQVKRQSAFRIVKTFMAAHADEPIFEAQEGAHRPLLVSTEHQPLISNEKLKQLYTDMLRARQHGKARSSSRVRRQTWKSLEASLVAATIDLRAEDSVISSSDLPIDTAAQRAVLEADSLIALATGAALLHRVQAKGNLVVAFVDARPSARNRQFLRIGQVQSLPIVYVEIEKTLPKTARTRTGITSIPVDKADVVAIYRVASEAIDKARRDAGPTLIQCVPFSLKKGSSVNHHSQDPIRYMEHYLRKKNLWSDQEQNRRR